LRIISGAFKGRKLHSHQGLSIRPTSDRTRESIFNILSSSFETFDGKRVLDLYAGTGALGIEALSRGAHKATFVEMEKGALSVLQHNVSFIPHPARYEIIGTSVASAIKLLQKRGERFDLIFMDPPYGKNLVQTTLEALAVTALFTQQTLVLCEHFIRDSVREQYGTLCRFDTRRYGQTLVSFFKVIEPRG
jgi:16S rRNA (guanine(966)-N(2))-methyltransferase RsmD